jgi:hypothetical protein
MVRFYRYTIGGSSVIGVLTSKAEVISTAPQGMQTCVRRTHKWERLVVALALLAGSSLDSGGDTSVHVNSHWSVTNICIAQAEA